MARPSQDHQIRIREILDVAEPLFYAKGYHETAISDIVKKMGIAKGTFYYYFKSKQEILETLIKRRISAFMSEVQAIADSAGITSPQKIESVIQAMFRTIRNNDEGLVFEYLYNDRTLHILDKISREGIRQLTPVLLKIIENGKQQNDFKVPHPLAAVNVILAVVDSMFDAIYEKSPDDLLVSQRILAESLIEKALGLPGKTIHIEENEIA